MTVLAGWLVFLGGILIGWWLRGDPAAGTPLHDAPLDPVRVVRVGRKLICGNCEGPLRCPQISPLPARAQWVMIGCRKCGATALLQANEHSRWERDQ